MYTHIYIHIIYIYTVEKEREMYLYIYTHIDKEIEITSNHKSNIINQTGVLNSKDEGDVASRMESKPTSTIYQEHRGCLPFCWNSSCINVYNLHTHTIDVIDIHCQIRIP